MPVPIAIVKADRSQLQPAFGLLADVRDHLGSIGIDQWDDQYPTIQAVQHDLDRGSLFIATLSGALVGTVAIDSDQAPEYQRIPWRHPGPSRVIHRLCVSPAHQGHGIGTAIMDFAEKHAMARGGSSIRLDVYRGNPGSVAFYQNRGYQMVGEFVIPWRSQPFCCMEKPLVQA
jgi:ribosomal protein S18 acetylase RimI-like enzyme